MENVHLFERAQAIIDARIDLQHIEPGFQETDGRQEVFPLQAIRIQLIRRIVRRHDEDDTADKQGIEQPAEDHRVGDIRDMEFVETDQAAFGGKAVGYLGQRVAFADMLLQFGMNSLHERMKVNAPLAVIGHRIVEAIHQEAFAPPDPAPEINALGDFRRRKKPAERTLTIDLEPQEIGVKRLKPLGGGALGRIGGKPVVRQNVFVGFDHPSFGDVEDSMRWRH